MARSSNELPDADTIRSVEALDEALYLALLRGSLGQIRAKRSRLVREGRATSNNEALSLSFREALRQGLR